MPRAKAEESDGEVDEYVVDKILDENATKYQVSWKGYDDVTWEPKKNLAQTAALDVWLRKKKKQASKSASPDRRRGRGERSDGEEAAAQPAKRRRADLTAAVARKPATDEKSVSSFVASEDGGPPEVALRKSSRSITAATSASSPRRATTNTKSAPTADEQDGYESAADIAVSLTKSSSKRGAASPGSPSKRQTINASPRARRRTVVVRQSSDEDDETRVEDNSHPEQHEVLEKYNEFDVWDGRIEAIETVERFEDEASLRYYVQWKSDGHETCWVTGADVHRKAPQTVISFLTSHLRWGR